MSYHPLQEESEVLFEVVFFFLFLFKRVEAQKGPGTSSYCIINSYRQITFVGTGLQVSLFHFRKHWLKIYVGIPRQKMTSLYKRVMQHSVTMDLSSRKVQGVARVWERKLSTVLPVDNQESLPYKRNMHTNWRARGKEWVCVCVYRGFRKWRRTTVLDKLENMGKYSQARQISAHETSKQILGMNWRDINIIKWWGREIRFAGTKNTG